MTTADILIIGGGVAGLSTAWHLVCGPAGVPGHRILLLERERFLGSESSGKNAAILRTLDPDPLISAVGRRSRAQLQHPPAAFTDVPLVNPCGLLLVGGPEKVADLRLWLAQAGSESGGEEVAPARARERAPFYGGPVAVAAWFPGEGRLDIAALLAGFAAGARRGGVSLRTAVEVRELLQKGGRVRGVRLRGGEEIRARTVINAAGGWAGRLGVAAGSRVSLRPTRRHLLVTSPDRRVEAGWPVVWSLDGFYCRPESGGLLLSACDEVEVDPDRCQLDGEVCEIIAEKTARLLPGLADLRSARFWCGQRTLTADGRFAIGQDPDVGGLFWVAGLGGHGMVCSFEVGRIAADLVAGRDPGDGLTAAFAPRRLVA